MYFFYSLPLFISLLLVGYFGYAVQRNFYGFCRANALDKCLATAVNKYGPHRKWT